jgi:uncharacterized membrane protein
VERIEKSIEVDVPVRTAYNQWTQFEEFPQFMKGVKEVKQLDDKRLFWRAEIAGVEKTWDAEIVDQIPDQRVAWRSTSGVRNAGMVTFHTLAPNRTKISLAMEFEPEGAMEEAGDALGIVALRIEGDLGRFKEFIESRGVETGAWRGEIKQGEVRRDDSMTRDHAETRERDVTPKR